MIFIFGFEIIFFFLFRSHFDDNAIRFISISGIHFGGGCGHDRQESFPNNEFDINCNVVLFHWNHFFRIKHEIELYYIFLNSHKNKKNQENLLQYK